MLLFFFLLPRCSSPVYSAAFFLGVHYGAVSIWCRWPAGLAIFVSHPWFFVRQVTSFFAAFCHFSAAVVPPLLLQVFAWGWLLATLRQGVLRLASYVHMFLSSGHGWSESLFGFCIMCGSFMFMCVVVSSRGLFISRCCFHGLLVAFKLLITRCIPKVQMVSMIFIKICRMSLSQTF
jgi:hypothetical protein